MAGRRSYRDDVEDRRDDAEKDEPARAVSGAEATLREDGGSSKLLELYT